MPRALTVIALLFIVGFGLWFGPGMVVRIRDSFHWHDVPTDAEIAQPYARQFAVQLQNDTRFTNVQVGVWGHGSKGPLYVRGTLPSDSDAAELRRKFDSLQCPVGVSWQIVVDTNRY